MQIECKCNPSVSVKIKMETSDSRILLMKSLCSHQQLPLMTVLDNVTAF